MNLPKIIPQYTEAKVSPKGWLNAGDLKKIGVNMLVFLTPSIILYGAQLQGALSDHTSLNLQDFIPSAKVIGAFQGYLISTFLDYVKKLNEGK